MSKKAPKSSSISNLKLLSATTNCSIRDTAAYFACSMPAWGFRIRRIECCCDRHLCHVLELRAFAGGLPYIRRHCSLVFLDFRQVAAFRGNSKATAGVKIEANSRTLLIGWATLWTSSG